MSNKALRISLDIALIVIGIVFLILGIKSEIDKANSNKPSDSVIFSKNFKEVRSDNIYDYVDLNEANEVLNNGVGVLLIGSKSDIWTHVLVAPLGDIVSEHLEKIYYLELEDVNKGDENYKKIEEKIGNIDKPLIVLVKDGDIKKTISQSELIDSDYEGTPIEYFDEERIVSLKSMLKEIPELK